MGDFVPALVSWNTTKACNLRCEHCYRDAMYKLENELTTEEGFRLIDDISELNDKCILILSGGEPLMREDIFDLARYASDRGLRVVLGTNGTLITEEVAGKLLDAGVKRVGISIDSIYPEQHDRFRGVRGAWEAAVQGAKNCLKVGLPFQIHITITSDNYNQLPQMIEFAEDLGASALHVFFLVAVGRGEHIAGKEITPQMYEELLNLLYDKQKETRIFLKATCAPQYYRVMIKRSLEEGREPMIRGRRLSELDYMSKGCLAGTRYCCILPEGEVHPCPYLPVRAGHIREDGGFKNVWMNSSVFRELRDPSLIKGKCGICEFKDYCGGCRARAYSRFRDYLMHDPACAYIPTGIPIKL